MPAIPPRQGQFESAIAIAQYQRYAIELQFTHIRNRVCSESLPGSTVEIPKLCFIEGVVQTEHLRGMVGLFDSLSRGSPHTLRGRVRDDEARVLTLKSLQFPHKPVELGVRDLGTILDVVEPLVMH